MDHETAQNPFILKFLSFAWQPRRDPIDELPASVKDPLQPKTGSLRRPKNNCEDLKNSSKSLSKVD